MARRRRHSTWTSTPRAALSGFSELTLEQLLDQIAARQPAPGGGTAAACTGATAAALVEMAASFAPDGSEHHGQSADHLRQRAAALRVQLLELAERDIDSYRPVLQALALAPDDPERTQALDRALSDAADMPLAIASASAEVADLAAAAAATGTVHLIGDATAAAVLAEAATRAAARLVELNLAGSPGDPRLRHAAELTAHASNQRAHSLRMS